LTLPPLSEWTILIGPRQFVQELAAPVAIAAAERAADAGEMFATAANRQPGVDLLLGARWQAGQNMGNRRHRKIH
jgi:hypothetical protein